MASTTTGLFGLFGEGGTDYLHELTRRATGILTEATAQAGLPRTVSIVRKTVATAGDMSRGILPTYNQVPGLVDLLAAVLTPSQWMQNDHKRPPVEFREGDRIVLIADIPNGSVLMTDRLMYDDPIYGVRNWTIEEAVYDDGANVTRIWCRYAKDTADGV